MMLSLIFVLATPKLQPLAKPNRVGEMAEWRIEGLPAPARPFDPGDWRIVATVTRPGEPPARVEAFWQAPYRPEFGPDKQVRFVATGKAGWRVRFTPTRPGRHRMSLAVAQAGKPRGTVGTSFDVKPGPLRGFVRASKTNPEYLAYRDGTRFLPIGWNAAWWNTGGPADYDRWAANMQRAGMNYVRLWMAPWSFGIENQPGTLGNYDLGRAWALDRVLETFRKHGIQVMLCFDYHGMLQVTKDYWGSNDNWRINPYNAANGGPAKTQNEFFTSAESRARYRQRLRYIVARYAAHPNVAVWEFWNEIDNVRQHYQEADMIAWHRDMAREIRAMDPYGRLVSTSLISDIYPTLWTDAKLDLVQSHSYNQSNPGPDFAERAKRFRDTYRRPYILGEYGVDYRAPKLEDDPNSRGLKQALWGSLLGGGAGTAQSWWWETLDAQNIYPMYRALANFVAATPIGTRGWRPMATLVPEDARTLPPAAPGARTFNVRIPLVAAWGDRNRGRVFLTDPVDTGAQASSLNGYVHGTSKPELRRPFEIRGHFAPGARFGYRLNSVSNRADLKLRINGREVFAKSYPDRDGKYEMNGEYNDEVFIDIPAGTATLQLENVGPDWAALDWVEISGAKIAQATGKSEVPLAAVASGTPRSAVVWALDPAYSYPANAKVANSRTVRGASFELLGLSAGRYRVRWFDTRRGVWIRTDSGVARGGRLRLSPPAFREDVAASVDRI